MNSVITYILAMICLLPATVGAIRYKRIDVRHVPLVFMMLLDVAMETIYRMKIHAGLAFNVYLTVNFALYLYLASGSKYVSNIFMWALVWVSIMIGSLNYVFFDVLCKPFLNEQSNLTLLHSIYLLCYVSVVALFISIKILSKQIIEINSKLTKNFWFWAGISFILYNAYTLLIFGENIFALSNTSYGKTIGVIHHFVNVAYYLFLTVAILKASNNTVPFSIKFSNNKISGYPV